MQLRGVGKIVTLATAVKKAESESTSTLTVVVKLTTLLLSGAGAARRAGGPFASDRGACRTPCTGGSPCSRACFQACTRAPGDSGSRAYSEQQAYHRAS